MSHLIASPRFSQFGNDRDVPFVSYTHSTPSSLPDRYHSPWFSYLRVQALLGYRIITHVRMGCISSPSSNWNRRLYLTLGYTTTESGCPNREARTQARLEKFGHSAMTHG